MNDVPRALLEILADGEEVLWWGMPDRRPHPTWRDFLEMPVAALCAYVSYTALRAMWASPVIIIGFLWPLIFALVPLFVFVVFPIQYVRLKRRTYFAVTNRRVVRLYAGRKTVLGDSRPLDLIGWVSALRCGKSSVHDLYIGKKLHLAETRDIRDYTGACARRGLSAGWRSRRGAGKSCPSTRSDCVVMTMISQKLRGANGRTRLFFSRRRTRRARSRRSARRFRSDGFTSSAGAVGRTAFQLTDGISAAPEGV